MIQTAKRLETVQEYYFSRKLKEVGQRIMEGKPIINMGIGSPDLPPHPSVIEAMQNALTNPKAHQYQSYQGIPELREAMAAFYVSRFGFTLQENMEFLPLMGSKEGILHISMAFLNPGDKVLIPNPGYPTYESVTRLVEAIPVFYDLTEENHWQPDFNQLENMDLTGVKVMWVCYPHMPTGANASFETYKKLIDFAQKHAILLVNDNPYSLILNPNPISIFTIDGAENCALELNSLSKSFNMAGWRVGMVLGNKLLINAILQVKSNMDSGMFFGIQKGAVQALQLGDDWFETLNREYSKRKNSMLLLAERLGCKVDSKQSGLFVWAKIPSGQTTEKFADRILYDYDIFITPGTVFGTNGEGFIRFSLCVDNEKIEEALSRIPLQLNLEIAI